MVGLQNELSGCVKLTWFTKNWDLFLLTTSFLSYCARIFVLSGCLLFLLSTLVTLSVHLVCDQNTRRRQNGDTNLVMHENMLIHMGFQSWEDLLSCLYDTKNSHSKLKVHCNVLGHFGQYLANIWPIFGHFGRYICKKCLTWYPGSKN